MSYHTPSQHSQEQKFRRIEWMRRMKRWLHKAMIIVVIILAFAVLLSYFFITQEAEPQDIEVHKNMLERI